MALQASLALTLHAVGDWALLELRIRVDFDSAAQASHKVLVVAAEYIVEPGRHLWFQGQAAGCRVLVDTGRPRLSGDCQVGLVLAEGGQKHIVVVGLVGDFDEFRFHVLVDPHELVLLPREGEVLAVIGHEDLSQSHILILHGDVLVEGVVAPIVPVDIGIELCNCKAQEHVVVGDGHRPDDVLKLVV